MGWPDLAVGGLVERAGCRGLSSRVAAVVPWCSGVGGCGECAQELTGA